MLKLNPTNTLTEIYENAKELLSANNNLVTRLDEHETNTLDIIIHYSESAKGVLAVLITSLLYKILYPQQDVRIHQANMERGYAGRGFDARYVTPFLKSQRFPSMAESGWLTRSLEQRHPYDYEYTGSIKPAELKSAFLTVLDKIQNDSNPKDYLLYLFQKLILQRDSHQILLAKPTNLSIHTIVDYLIRHFNSKYSAPGASRLPVLAIYAIYQCMMEEAKRFETKVLMPIESHNSSDVQSGRIGDIEVRDENDRVFEGIEVKHGIKISLQMVKDAYEKFSTTPVKRYYILSTAELVEEEKESIYNEIKKIETLHGCQVIPNGMIHSLKYYLRLLSDPYEFTDRYVNLLEIDQTLKFEHKHKWNEIAGGGL